MPAREELERDILLRLKKVEGQVRGIQRMVEEKRDCAEVIGQLMAIRSAIDKVGLLLIDNQIDFCKEGQVDLKEELKALQQTLRAMVKFR